MSSSLTKRQQVRNEKALQDLIKSVPGNSTCADCGARNPGWASWSFGIFLCMRCAALHRKLGTHISKVKSLSMDSWSTEQVDNMKRMGNIASNRIYNASNARPPVPIDADEADSAMERFIRSKYKDSVPQEEHHTVQAYRRTGSSGSDDNPPPLPPKPTSRFGFRSASSIFPMSSKHKREAAAKAYLENQEVEKRGRERKVRSPSPRGNKQSRVFGQSIPSDHSSGDFETKLVQLRDMGFMDERKNTIILKELSGNLEKSIETLVRLGERSGPPSRSRTPLTAPLSAGLSINRSKPSPSPTSPAFSNNPWEIPPAQFQSSQSTGALSIQNNNDQQADNSLYNSSNPFGVKASRSQYNLNQQYSLDQSLQNLSLSQSQPLFPNHTGGAPNRSFHTGIAPPMPSIPQGQYSSPVSPQTSQGYNPFLQQPQPQPQPQLQQPLHTQDFTASPISTVSSNPFGMVQRTQTLPQLPQQPSSFDQAVSQQQDFFNNPQAQQQPQLQNPYGQFPDQQPPVVQQQNPYAQQMQTSQPPPQQQSSNPFNQQMQQSQTQQSNPFNQQFRQPQQQQQQQQQPQQQQNPYNNYQLQQQQLLPAQQLLSQPTRHVDKSSILALYNVPQPTPASQMQQAPNDNQFHQHPQNPYQTQIQNPASEALPNPAAVQQNISGPITSPYGVGGSKNPFMHNSASVTSGSPFGQQGMNNAASVNGNSNTGGMNQFGMNGNGRGHVSQDSIAVDSNGWYPHNGRHSPDAFANLSARAM